MIRMIILVGGLLVTNGALGNLLGVPSYWAFPFNGCSHGLAVAAPGHGQVALGAKKVALGPPLVQVRATFFAPSTTWPWPCRRRQAMGTPSN